MYIALDILIADRMYGKYCHMIEHKKGVWISRDCKFGHCKGVGKEFWKKS